jgi:trehalose 6-phosphate phosphatase
MVRSDHAADAGGSRDVLAARLVGDHLASAVEQAGLFCDFDGTLAPIVADPATSRLPAAAAPLLIALAARLRVVALVSGRPADFLAARAALEGVRLLGLYGLEEWNDGHAVARPEAASWAGVVRAVRDRLPGLVGHLSGVQVEDKGLSVAVHWRNAAERARAEVEVAGVVRALAGETGLHREPGKLVEELRPPVAWDKGSAVRAVAADAGLTRLAYIGDDRGDLAAFAAVRALGGVGVAVAHGDETPPEVIDAADVAVDGHAGVLALLTGLRSRLEASPATDGP